MWAPLSSEQTKWSRPGCTVRQRWSTHSSLPGRRCRQFFRGASSAARDQFVQQYSVEPAFPATPVLQVNVPSV